MDIDHTTGLKRRDLLTIGLAAAGVSALSGCNQAIDRVVGVRPPNEPTPAVRGPDRRLFDRIAFGATAPEQSRLAALGRDGYVEEQLRADREEPWVLRAKLNRLDVVRLDGYELGDLPEPRILEQLQQSALLRAVYSPNQLRERMVDLWTNHFSIYVPKARGKFLKGRDDLEVIRTHALGSFPDLVKASARSPAMLGYLDNQVNRKGVPNENYARELMELHTLGVDGGYTQRDVMEVARCFTGWTYEQAPPLVQIATGKTPVARGHFRFDPNVHDDGPKVVLGQRIPAKGGMADGERVLDILTSHPSCARFVARKIGRYFLGEAAAQVEDEAARAYRRTGGDIKAVLRPVLSSDAILDGPPIVKRPFDLVVSSLRALYADTDGRAVGGHLREMGQPLHEWPMPDGYPDRTAAWTGTFLARWNYALALAGDQIAGTTIEWEGLEQAWPGGPAAVWEQITGTPAPAWLRGHDTRQAVAMALSAPEYQWR
ncbi:MAG: DUF1800 domain-containing protein [Fimbriimonadaceae bacterium]|nr:DUF1800 domain-containing protein [Fimbriimonadaceae bacterium]